MTALPEFERSVFINAPFDSDFAPTLQAIAFCVADLGFAPRLAPENADNGVSRLQRIEELVRGSKFGIHDLSRCKSAEPDEFYRLNMPFELGLDHGCAAYGSGPLAGKSILVLEGSRYDSQKSLSDISGWDVDAHQGDFKQAVRVVSRWLIRHAGATPHGSTRILNHYTDFLGWHWERELERGASEEDIREYPTIEFVHAMNEWIEAGRPL